MDATIYLNTTTLVARAADTGIAVPAITARLQAHLKLTCYFFATGEEPALLSGATFRVALKDVNEPSGTVLALLSSPTDTGADYYEFEWASLDSSGLRTLLGDQPEASVIVEIEWTIGGTVERVAIPATVENAWIRTADAAPDFEPFQASITALGYLRLVNSDGDVFHIGLNSGEPPSS